MIRRLRRWWRKRNEDSGEICRECLCDLRWRDLWETRQHFTNTVEMTFGGGSYMTAYWCPKHRPDDAVRSHP